MSDSISSNESHNIFNTEQAKQTILRYLETPPDHWKLSRIVWRAGELSIVEAGDKIIEIAKDKNLKEFLQKTDSGFIMQYSCLWALASCGQSYHVPMIRELKGIADNNLLQRLSLAVQLKLSTDDGIIQQIRDEILYSLPTSVTEAINTIHNNKGSATLEILETQLRELVKPKIKQHRYYQKEYIEQTNIDHVVYIYLLSRIYPFCKQVILKLVNDGSFHTSHFLIIKQIFKLSQLYQDTEMFARLIPVFETLKPLWENGYDRRSINYFRRRSWRVLYKLGESGQAEYLDFAESILLQVSDDDAESPKVIQRREFDWETYKNRVVSERQYGRFPKLLAFNHILYQHSEQMKLVPSRFSWYISKKTADTGRTEAFPELWDTAPDRLLNLLLQGRCEEVHHFAILALRDNTHFCQQLSNDNLDDLKKLMSSNYETTAKFALELVVQAFNNSKDNQKKAKLIKSCLQASYVPAKEQGRIWIAKYVELLTIDLSLLAYVIFYSYQLSDLIELIYLNSLTSAQKDKLIQEIIFKVEQSFNVSNEHIRHIIDQLKKLTGDCIRTVRLEEIVRLLSDQLHTHRQLFGALLLLENSIEIIDISEELISKINNSSSSAVQAVAVSLLGKYSDGELLDKYKVLFEFVVSDHDEMRQAVSPIILRISKLDNKNNSRFSDRILNDIIPYIFRTETSEGLHDDLLKLASTYLNSALLRLNNQLRWRLLQAQSKAAKQLGAMGLSEIKVDSYSIKQWALLGNHEMLSVRQCVWSVYQQQKDLIILPENLNHALRLMNAKWVDSRYFAINYFRNLDDSVWSPEFIINICDSTFDDVQLLGRELLIRCLKEDQGLMYLTRLSQHPSQNVQLFTTNFLADYARDNFEYIQMLKPYFITVLSYVFKGRTAKDRVIQFLNQEAVKSKKVAELVIDIYTRQSVTISIIDKSQYIQGMHMIKETYPDLNSPIVIKPLSIKGRNSSNDIPKSEPVIGTKGINGTMGLK